jgi:cytochrome c biogenesis protein CcdA
VRRSRTIGTLSWLVIGTASFEVGYISLQAALGAPSHYNTSDPFHAAMFGLMGIAAVVLVATQAVLARLVLRHARPLAPLAVAVAIGLVLTCVLSILSGFLLGGLRPPAGIGLPGQFGVGLLLGVVWSPCVGPTLGAASAMAARGENLGAVALTMLAFGLGAALPLLALGSVSRGTMAKWRGGLMAAGQRAKMALGVLLVALAALMLSGADRSLESWLVDLSPEWLTRLTTSF